MEWEKAFQLCPGDDGLVVCSKSIPDRMADNVYSSSCASNSSSYAPSDA